MNWGMAVYLVLLLAIVIGVARDAWHDRTPRDPVVRRALFTPQVFWATKHSWQERRRAHIGWIPAGRGLRVKEMTVVNLRMKVDPDGPLGPEEASFIAQMRRQVKSENTVGAYIWGLKHLRAYLRDNGITGFEGINREVLEEWQDYLATNVSPLKGKPLAPRSQGLCASAARMFFTWAAIRDKCDAKLPLLFTKVKVAPLQPKPLKHDVMLRIRHYFIEKTGTPRYMRDRALFFYTIGVGARVSEVLRVPRVGWERVTVVQKGGSLKTLICPDIAADMVRAYLATRVDECPALWVKKPGKTNTEQITPAGVRYLWTQLCRRLEVKRFVTHQLRHTAATAMLAAGEDPMAVAKFLGHKNLQTLDVYAEVPESQRARTTATMDRFLKAG